MQKDHLQWRIAFARQLARKLTAFEGLKAIVIAGSVARGYADEYADVELPIFWQSLPADATRQGMAEALNAVFLDAYDGPAGEDQLLINGLQVDLWHIAVAQQEEILAAVLQAQRFDLGSLNALDTIRFCIPLHGEELVQDWKRRAQAYPDELAGRVIQVHLAEFKIRDLFILAQRNNPTAFYARLSFLQQEMFLVLLALNRSYFPTFKWLYRALETMPVKPKDMAHRFRQAYQSPWAEALADTQRLLEETIALVEERMPQIDTASVYHRLAYVRTAHETPLAGR